MKKEKTIYDLMEGYCAKMTPAQYKKNIDTVVKRIQHDSAIVQASELTRISREYNEKLTKNSNIILNTMMVEFIFELGKQMEYWDEDGNIILDESTDNAILIKESIKFRIQEIVENVMKATSKYSEIDDEIDSKIFEHKKEKIKEEFNIIF